jgi:hypothetical protein
MTDDRPAPQYGEYATPQQQAAAMGREYVPPPPPPTIAPNPTVAPPQGAQAPQYGNLVDRFVTSLQLGVGVFALITSDWFHVAVNVNLALAQAGATTRIPTAVDRYGWVLLGANILFLAATIAWTYVALRRGHRAYYIPFVGYCAFTIGWVIFSYAVTR